METQQPILLSLQNIVPRQEEFRFAKPINWTIREGEQWAVVGPNGAGKTLLIDILQRKHFIQQGEVVVPSGDRLSDLVRCIAFKDIYSMADCRNTYYQQRWHATETDELPTIAEILQDRAGASDYEEILQLFGVEEFLPKKFIYLSSGELRKFLIVRTLLTHPKLLILDNPYIGLDAPSREVLTDMLLQMHRLKGVQVVLLLSNPADLPEMITHVLPIKEKTLLPTCTREAFLHDQEMIDTLFPPLEACESVQLPVDPDRIPSEHTVTLRMEHVTIRYGSRTILKDLDWEVKNGEKWALFGPNGSGKSTLLSLVYADNPQSYANTFYLFDRKRGSGESIWEIKKRIGYISPEMHLYYMENVPTLHIVASGYFDSVGLYRKCSAEQKEGALAWMRVLGIDHLKDRPFMTLSSGEQRMVLLARSFVKDPDLIILDEPLHGLDASRQQLAARVIKQFVDRPGKTLIYVTHYPEELPSCVDRQFTLEKH